MKKFAKLFESEKHGQLVVIKQTDDDGVPEIRLFLLPENLGVCSIAISFVDDSEKSCDECHRIFEEFDIEKAESMAQSFADYIAGPTKERNNNEKI